MDDAARPPAIAPLLHAPPGRGVLAFFSAGVRAALALLALFACLQWGLHSLEHPIATDHPDCPLCRLAGKAVSDADPLPAAQWEVVRRVVYVLEEDLPAPPGVACIPTSSEARGPPAREGVPVARRWEFTRSHATFRALSARPLEVLPCPHFVTPRGVPSPSLSC